jgi:hypothetical protein
MNFWMRLSLGLAIWIHESERHGRRAKDWRSSSRIAEPYWFWMAWSRSKIRLAHKKGGCVSLLSRRFCANFLLSTQDFASLPRVYLSPILQITSAPRSCGAANRVADCCWVGCSTQTEAGSPGYQTE